MKMPKLKPGDRIDCKIESGVIVSPYHSYDEIKTFEIVAVERNGYYLYVPNYYSLKNTSIADEYRCRKLRIDKRFTNCEIIYISESMILALNSILDGKTCVLCGEFYQYAEANQPDGALICFPCRVNPYR